jgi:hypothetical protein
MVQCEQAAIMSKGKERRKSGEEMGKTGGGGFSCITAVVSFSLSYRRLLDRSMRRKPTGMGRYFYKKERLHHRFLRIEHFTSIFKNPLCSNIF